MPQQRRLLQNPAFIVLEIIISTHAPTGATSSSLNSNLDILQFQSTPQQGRLRLIGFFSPYQGDFNPRPNRGDFAHTELCQYLLFYFNPRPTRGDFPNFLSNPTIFILFQSTPQQGRLLPIIREVYDVMTISIHAPTGATSNSFIPIIGWTDFNPRPNRGDFPYQPLVISLAIDFNPRPNRGDFGKLEELGKTVDISIHAPTGATSPHNCDISDSYLQFQSTPQQGRLRRRKAQQVRRLIFQSTPQQGRLLDTPSPYRNTEISIHAPTGATSDVDR